MLAGPNVPSGWQGGLPLPYHVGPGPAEVRLSVSMDYQIRTIWNVIATIPGTVEPDRWVMIGNHRDAWVYGAVDPGSGTAATLEMCRALGAAVKNGWKPRRTLIYASWDAEEYGLVGSTEWAEENAEDVKKKAVLDAQRRLGGQRAGVRRSAASPRCVTSCSTRRGRSTTSDRAQSSAPSGPKDSVRPGPPSSPLVLLDPIWDSTWRRPTRARPRPRISSPRCTGSAPALTTPRSSITWPSRRSTAACRGGYGVYHSIYDDFNWMEKFGDPEFLNHATAARLYTLIAMRAAAADVVPFRFVPYGLALREHVDELRLIHARRVRQEESAKAKAGTEFEGVPELVEAVRDFQAQAEELDRATEAVSTATRQSPPTG